MKTLQWTDALSVGVELIDNQHRTWIAHFNRAAAAVASAQGPTQIIETLGFLVDYTSVHFSTEERHMSASGYPELTAHKAKHDQLTTTLADLVQDFEEEGATHVLADAVDTLLGNWLIRHIQEVDMRFGAFVKERGIVVSDPA